ncbi:hypothetical protein DYZ85_00757 [Listeria monocytogenes]|uniref:DUF2247 family protein n=1 Tax=Listeria monocytogenes TaxID=1639 RepID=UPI000E7210F9|nr:DUF2247 family protein [Listeria monocytogenes]RKA27975.1 hypothetical protein DYZ85_00757 [Listeria monocytogenes]
MKQLKHGSKRMKQLLFIGLSAVLFVSGIQLGSVTTFAASTATSGPYTDVNEYVYNYLLKNNVNTDTVKDKYLYVLLKLVWENENNYADPLEVIEYIYADLDYPSEIEHLVRYMPMKHKNMGSIELNVAEMYKDWETFLIKKSKIYL